MKNAIPKSQFKRVHRIVSDKTRQTQRLDEMRSKFLERGYPPQTLNTSETISTTRTSSKDRIPFVHDYHPLSYILHRSISRYWHILGTAHPRIKEFKEPFLPCFRRPRNIRDKLVRADIGTIQQTSTQRFLTNPKYGTFPCLQCTQCNNVTRGSTFYHPHNGKQYNIKGYFTCDTSFVVYLIKCPCGLCYIGETTQPIKDRISKHKSTIRRLSMLWQKFRDHHLKALSWAAQSPDLKPIENLWNVIKRMLDSHKPSNKEELLTFLRQKQCERLVESMLRRMKAVIKYHGYSIKY
ncbi:unnamed protein product [Ranitomeya imitator]|uniref:Helix-turn-helix domain-containing protein n=1 Tax=Ranitomeya imitator TaxID=111125 RepID=A0ABN9LNN8_9NEOB|nr:unnamed protein product [Ranitomeya imitator]